MDSSAPPRQGRRRRPDPSTLTEAAADARCFGARPNSVTEAAALAQWRTTGGDRVLRHRAELAGLVRTVGPLIDRGAYAEAATAAQIAANHAVLWHAGVFVHPELERQLRRLGETALPFAAPPSKEPRSLSRDMAILHVATELAAIGGHTRMLTRWIRHDGNNIHSLALTRQKAPVHDEPRSAVNDARGRFCQLNLRRGGILQWARALQPLLAEADLVVLHVHNMDIIPMIALAGMKHRPRTVLLNHADHLFWLGADFIDHAVNTRRSGMDLNVKRRGIPPERNLLIPLCLEPQARRLSREEARKQLGFPPDCVVLLSVARALKFRPLGGVSFADVLVPVLQRNPDAHLLVVGPGGEVDWSTAEAQAPGQIRIVRQTPDTGIYLEAADIYVDSFPFVSITSLFEAGLNGLPLVTRNPFGRGCEIMGADSIGLDKVLWRARDIEDFRNILTRLIRNRGLRDEIGERTRAQIEAVNSGDGWRRELDRLYRQVFSTPPASRGPTPLPAARLDTVDRLLPAVFGPTESRDTTESRIVRSMEPVIKTAPLGWRLRTLLRLAGHGQLNLLITPAWRLFIPEWLTANIRAVLPHGGRKRRTKASAHASRSDVETGSPPASFGTCDPATLAAKAESASRYCHDRAPIEILFCADPGFYRHTAVAAVSLAENNPGSPLNIHVLSCDGDAAAQAMLGESLAPYRHVTLVFHSVPAARLANVFTDRHLTKETYMRFLAPEILPRDIHRLLYLDSDLVVLDDVEPLWNTNLNGKALAAAPELPWQKDGPMARQAALLGLDASHTYVNAGVLLLDLDRWRNDRLSSRLFAYAEHHKAALVYHDQDAINAVCRDDIEVVDCRWNLQARMYLLGWRSMLPGFRELRQARRHPRILHYTTGDKPWHFRSQTGRKRHYLRYLEKTAWRDVDSSPLSPLQRIEWWLGRRLLNIGIDYMRLAGRSRSIAVKLAGLTRAWGRMLPRPTLR